MLTTFRLTLLPYKEFDIYYGLQQEMNDFLMLLGVIDGIDGCRRSALIVTYENLPQCFLLPDVR
jgi:hypothetical protein